MAPATPTPQGVLAEIGRLWDKLGPWVVVLVLIVFYFDQERDTAQLLQGIAEDRERFMQQLIDTMQAQTVAIQEQTAALKALGGLP